MEPLYSFAPLSPLCPNGLLICFTHWKCYLNVLFSFNSFYFDANCLDDKPLSFREIQFQATVPNCITIYRKKKKEQQKQQQQIQNDLYLNPYTTFLWFFRHCFFHSNFVLFNNLCVGLVFFFIFCSGSFLFVDYSTRDSGVVVDERKRKMWAEFYAVLYTITHNSNKTVFLWLNFIYCKYAICTYKN